MQTNYCFHYSVLITVLITFFICTLTDQVQAAPNERSCIVNQVLDGGTVTYIRCREGAADVWLSTARISVANGEQLSFIDAPPMINFESRHIKRTFPQIIDTTVRKSGERSGTFMKVIDTGSPLERAEPSGGGEDTTFVGSDDNGTLVFSDDPSRVPNIRNAPTREENIQEKVRIRSVTVLEFGRYSADSTAGSYAAQTNSGVVDPATNIQFLEKTSRITARFGSVIGMTYRVDGTPFDEVVNITIKVLSPSIYNPLTKKRSKIQSWVAPKQLNAVTYDLYKFEQPWELVPGTWTMQILYKGKVLASQSFQVEL